MNRRRTDMKPESDPSWFAVGALIAVSATFFIVAVALAFMAQAGELPASVLVTEISYTQGTLVHECWLDQAHYGAIGTGYGLIVECRSDIDGLFKNGFEVTP